MLRSAVVLMLALILTAETCDVGNLNIADFVVTHEITVVNNSSVDVIVAINPPDLARNALLERNGGSVQATSFANGTLIITASGDETLVAKMNKDRDELLATFRTKGGTAAQAQAKLDGIVGAMVVMGKSMGVGTAGAFCSRDMKVGADGKGLAVAAEISGESPNTLSMTC